MKIFKFVLAVSVMCLGLPAHAFYSPLSLSILPPVQFPPEDFSITGARLSLFWGKHRDLYGLDVGGIGNITEQTFVGIGVAGAFNWTKGNTTILGLQLAGGANINTNKTNVYGLQAALGLNYNSAASSVTGLQLALVNIAPHTTINGFQVGVYNRALAVRGFQIGLVNITETLSGVQIGLINFHRKGVFPVSPLLNIGF